MGTRCIAQSEVCNCSGAVHLPPSCFGSVDNQFPTVANVIMAATGLLDIRQAATDAVESGRGGSAYSINTLVTGTSPPTARPGYSPIGIAVSARSHDQFVTEITLSVVC